MKSRISPAKTRRRKAKKIKFLFPNLAPFAPLRESFLRVLGILYFIDSGNFHLLKAPALFHRRRRIDTQTGGDARLWTGRVKRRASDPRNDNRVLVRLETRRHCPVH